MAGYDRFSGKDTSWLTASQQLLQNAKSGDYNSKATISGPFGINEHICLTDVTNDKCETKLANNEHGSNMCNRYFYQDPTNGQRSVCRNPKSNYNPFGKKSKFCRSEALSGSGNYTTSGKMSCQKAKDRLNNSKDFLPSARIDPTQTDWIDNEGDLIGGAMKNTRKRSKTMRKKQKQKMKTIQKKRDIKRKSRKTSNKHKQTVRKHMRKSARGTSQSRQRSRQAVSYRKSNPLSAKIHRGGPLSGHIEGALRESGTVAHGPSVGTQRQSTEENEDRNMRLAVRDMLKEGKPKERRGDSSHSRLAFYTQSKRKHKQTNKK